MTFNPNIPLATDLISSSQSDIKTNFGQLNTIFANDHYTWNNATASYRGLHTQITFPTTIAAPSTPAGLKSLLTPLDVSGVAQLLFTNSVGAVNLTGSITSGTNSQGGIEYSIVTPFGITFVFGTTNVSNVGLITQFVNNFATAALGVIITPRHAGALSCAVTGPSRVGGTDQFVGYLQAGPGSQAAYYFAWGN